MCNRRYAVNRIQLLRENFSEKEQKFKVHGTISKDYLGNDNQYGLKK